MCLLNKIGSTAGCWRRGWRKCGDKVGLRPADSTDQIGHLEQVAADNRGGWRDVLCCNDLIVRTVVAQQMASDVHHPGQLDADEEGDQQADKAFAGQE